MHSQSTPQVRGRAAASIGVKALGAAIGLAAVSAAHAHPGHGAQGLAAGIVHPFAGADHLLAMVAVGMWSFVALPKAWRVAGPAVFLSTLLLGAALASGTAVLPQVEAGVALSVVVLAALLLGAHRIPPAAGLSLIALAGVFHGHAHGSELVAGQSFLGYATGFMITSALLHGAGLLSGIALQRLPAWIWRTATALIGASGLLLLATRL